MSIIRQYVMLAASGRDAALQASLSALSDVVRRMDGSEGVELMSDLAEPRRYVLQERWTTDEARRSAGASIPQNLMASLMAALESAPQGSTLQLLSAGRRA